MVNAVERLIPFKLCYCKDGLSHTYIEILTEFASKSLYRVAHYCSY